ncbi:MAG: hypothetical protein GY822_00515 [Deltaproteobacteria bacterium]|nr:hypothetical protein [Deltaproteobacteria bacterium]
MMIAFAVVGLSLTFGCPTDPIGNDAGTADPSPFPDTPAPSVEPDPAPSSEPADGGSDEDGGNSSDFDAGPSPVYIESVSPSTGVLTGGIRVRISGDAFTPDSQVFFNDVEADQLLYLNSRAITVRVPAGLVAGPADVRVENDLGIGFLEGAFTYFSPVLVGSVVPNVGSSAGGENVQLTGEGFTEDMIVLIGGTPVVNYGFESETSATFLTPPGLSGRVDVVALDAFGRSVLPFGFTYTDDLSLVRVLPQIIPAANTADLNVFGSGFDEATTFTIGGQAAAVTNFISSTRVRLDAPVALLGYADLVATRATSSATLTDAFFFADAPAAGLSLVSVMPRILDGAGGESIVLSGTSLDTVTSVKVDGNDVTPDLQNASQIVFTSPAHAAGTVDIEINDDVTTLSLSVSYESRLSLASLTPAQGGAEGGTEVALTGAHFADGMQVFFGAIEAAQVTFVDENNATVMSPFGAPGLSDVTVVLSDEHSTLSDSFLYESDLSVLGVRPARGGISGNTFVTVSGSGFTLGDVTVRFAQLEATSVTVVSDSLLTARTPFNAPGSVDVTVDIAGQLPVVAQRAYTYFDPSILVGGTRGGAVDGALYLTAIDALSGMPIEGLLAFLGTEGGGSVMAKTNILGQATLSGLEVVGPQTVSVVGDGYEYASLVDVNASEVTVFLQPLNLVPPTDGPPPPPEPPPATMRGRVFGFAKEFFDPAALNPDEIALAVVVTTSRDEFSGTPDPGGDNVVFAEGGEYYIANSRTGQVAIVALAGIFNLDTAQLRIKQMGVLRGVFPQRGVDLIDQDIELNIPLDKEIDLSLPDAPVGILDGPTVTRVLPFLRFGGEGAFAYTQAVDTSRNHDLDTMPDVPGEMLTFIAGAYRTDGTGLVTDEGSATMIEGDDVVLGVGTDWAQVDFFGQLLVEGAIFVIEGEDGENWASHVARSLGPGEILLADKAPFTLAGATFHIGNPGLPSSEVMQDGVGDLIGGVTIQPVLGIPEPLSPVKNGVLENRTLRWKPAPGQQPSMHQMWVYDAINFSILWTFYIDGDRTKVPLPRIPDVEGMEFDTPPPEMPAGGYLWQHISMYAPGFDYNSFSYLDIGTRARRAWTTNATLFVYGGD